MGIGLLARQSDTVSASTTCHVGVVNTDICRPITLADQTLTSGRALIDIVDISVRWVAVLWLVRGRKQR